MLFVINKIRNRT